MVSLEGRRPTAPSIGFQRATSGQRAVAKIAKLANKHALKCAAEIGEFLTPPRAPATRRAMHRNFSCFSILGLTSIRALLSVIRDMTAMPAASPRTESDRADRHRRAAGLPRRQCCATTNFSSAAAWPPGQACQCREKQQRPGLSPTAVIKAQVPREVRSQSAPQYEDRAGDVTSTSSSSSPSSWPWLTSFSPDDIEVG